MFIVFCTIPLLSISLYPYSTQRTFRPIKKQFMHKDWKSMKRKEQLHTVELAAKRMKALKK